MNKVIEQLMNKFPKKTEFSAAMIKDAAIAVGENPRSAYVNIRYTHNAPTVRRGVYNLESMMPKSSKAIKAPAMVKGVESVSNDEVFVPEYDPTFVAWGNFNEIIKVLKSGMFYPTFVSGLSGIDSLYIVHLTLPYWWNKKLSVWSPWAGKLLEPAEGEA